MKTLKIIFTLGLITFGLNCAFAEYVPLRIDVQGDRPAVQVLRHDDNLVQVEVRIPGIEFSESVLDGKNWKRVTIPGGSFGGDLGHPEVPFFSRMLAIPATAGVRVEFEALEVETIPNIELMPAQETDPEYLTTQKQPVRYDQAAYSQDAFTSEVEATCGEPALMRGLRLVNVRMNPVRYNPVTKELKIAHRFQVNIHFEGTDLRNAPARAMRPVSQTWYNMWSGLVMNLDEIDLEVVPMGSYLMIAENDNNLVNNILPAIIDWKKRKGHTVVLETFSPGASANTIKNIIQNAYDNWEIPPEYVLLWGDETGSGDYDLAAWYSSYGFYSSYNDHPYSQLDGGDILADVSVGRYPADNATQAQTMVNKTLYYEKHPYIGNTQWYKAGVLVAGYAGSGYSTIQCNRWIKTRMVERNYTRIDTFWYWMGNPYTYVPQTMTQGINNGALYVNYRGWVGMQGFDNTDIGNLTNYFMLPYVTIPTCGTGDWNGTSNMEKFVTVGTPTAPKGAIACVGSSTTGTHTKYNNAVDMGIYAAIFLEDLPITGPSLNRGKLELYNAYQQYSALEVEKYSVWNNLGGDPGLVLFTHGIQFMESSIPATVSLGENALTLTVNETSVGPLENATVCFYKEGELQEVGLTDASGQVTLPLNPTNTGNVKVTITKQNFYPIVDSLDVVQSGVTVGYFNHTIDDDYNGSSSGDNDGLINPGEQVEIPLTFKNYGNSTTATSVEVTASVNDDYASLNDNYETFPNISPGATANSNDDLDLVIDPACPHGHMVRLDLVTGSGQGSWDGVLDLEVVSYSMTVRDAYASGGDPLLSPGETANFILQVSNDGGKTASSLTAVMTSLSTYVTVNDNSASFGSVGIGSTTTCSANPFNLTADSNTPPGFPADLVVTFTSSSGATQTDTITIDLGSKSSTDPQGPDEYGYFCFDNTDTGYPTAPIYSWVEINPGSGGSGTQLPINDPGEDDDESCIVNLPFTFQYYGQETDAITVCSNGWISITANVSFANFANYHIPSSMGPDGLIAPFWDDLITGSGGYVYKWHDSANHRFVIQWDYMRNRYTGVRETFEVILYEPGYPTTPTGDGEILFQYQSITEVQGYSYDNYYSTVGIERPDHQDGIEVVYWNTYDDPAAAHLQNNRAYLFTTNFQYGPSGPANMTVNLTYNYGSPVPSGGGYINFDVFLQNNETSTVNFDLWIEIPPQVTPPSVPNRNLTFPASYSLTRPDMPWPIPASWPAGNYDMVWNVGDLSTLTVWATDSFPFVKSASSEGGQLPDWALDGDPLDQLFNDLDISEPATVSEFAFLGSYPNPFNPTSTLSFALPEASKVILKIYDVHGRTVATLIDAHRQAGYHDVTFDATGLTSGIYIYRLSAGDFTATGKMVLMK